MCSVVHKAGVRKSDHRLGTTGGRGSGRWISVIYKAGSTIAMAVTQRNYFRGRYRGRKKENLIMEKNQILLFCISRPFKTLGQQFSTCVWVWTPLKVDRLFQRGHPIP